MQQRYHNLLGEPFVAVFNFSGMIWSRFGIAIRADHKIILLNPEFPRLISKEDHVTRWSADGGLNVAASRSYAMVQNSLEGWDCGTGFFIY